MKRKFWIKLKKIDHTSFLRMILTAIIGIILINCSFAPRHKNHIKDIDIPTEFRNQVMVEKNEVSATNWWESFEDSQLNSIVEKVIENNLDLELAILRVESMEAQFKITRGQRLPGISTTGSYTKSEGPVANMEVTPTEISTITEIQEIENYQLRTGFKFELDIWGKLRDTNLAALESLKASKSDLRTIYIGIISQTITSYYEILAQLEENKLVESNYRIAEKSFNILITKYRQGLISKEAFEIGKQNLNNMKTSLKRADQLLNLKNNQLSLLMGEYPNIILSESNGCFDKNIHPENVPFLIPSDLLKSRSDILSAEQNMEAARRLAGAGFADLFPSLSISAAMNFSSMDFADLFDDLSLTKSITGEVNQTIFAGGSKLASYKQKKVQYEQAVVSYKRAVLAAFADVENALKNMDFSKTNYQNATENMESLKSTFDINKRKYKIGLITFSMLQESERNYYAAKSNKIQSDLGLISAKVQLHSALGGEWIE